MIAVRRCVRGLLLVLTLAPALRPQATVLRDLEAPPPRFDKSTSTLAAGTRAAVLVAADGYERHAEWALLSAKTSADVLRQRLAEYGGFAPAQVQVLSGRDVHEAAVRSAIVSAGERAGKATAGVLYLHWIGHGWVQDGEQQMFGFYTDETGGSFAPAVARRQLLAWLQQAQAKAAARGAVLQPVLVVDACRVARGAPPPRARLVQGTVFELYGSKDGDMVAADQGGGGFAFTAAFGDALAALAAAGGEVALDVVFREARDRTLRATGQRQEPVLLAPAGAPPPALVVQPQVTFALRTVDALSGARVETASVRCDDSVHALRDASLLLTVTPGAHVLAVHAEGFLPRTETITLTREQDAAEWTLPLLPALTIVRGRLLPPAVASVRAATAMAPRAGYHLHATTSAPDGTFELRLAGTGSGRIEVVHEGQVLQAQDLPPPTAMARDRSGAVDAIFVIELTLPLTGAALAATGAAAVDSRRLQDLDAPVVTPDLASSLDRVDFDRARAAVAKGRFDLARSDLRGIDSSDPALLAWRDWVDRRWARDVLERALRTGVASGDFTGVEEVQGWLLATLFTSQPGQYPGELRQLFDEVDRERIPLLTRQAWNTANTALAAGELEVALQSYTDALAHANPHYRALIETQIAQVKDRLYGRQMSAGAECEVRGDIDGALAAYTAAMRYQPRARHALARVLRDPRLRAAEPTVRAQAEALLAAADHADQGDTSIYEQLTLRPAAKPALDTWLQRARATRALAPEGNELFRELEMSPRSKQRRVLTSLAAAQQALDDATASFVRVGDAYDALLASDDAAYGDRQQALASALSACNEGATKVAPTLDAIDDAATTYFKAWRDEAVVPTTDPTLRRILTHIVDDREATVAAATRALRAANATLDGALSPLAAQVAFAAEHAPAAARATLRSRRAALAESAGTLQQVGAVAQAAVQNASTQVLRTEH